MNSVIWKPQAKQAMAMSCPATELFYGGAAGGGKSDFLLGDFLQQAAKYGKRCHGILFRQSYSELEELIARSREIYEPIKAIFKITNKQWYFPNGATLKMRYVESNKDLRRYQGHQYTWVGFDELGNFPTDDCWTFLISRLRSPAGVPCYIRGTANPGGVGHSWIKNRFMDGHEPNKIFIVEKNEGKKTTKTSRVFIPSRLEDNKILMNNDPQYEARLLSLPPHLARAMRYGDWSVFSGQIFEEFRCETHVVKPFLLEAGLWFKFCALDWGYTKPYSLGWWAVNKDGKMIKYREWYGCVDGEMNKGVKKGSKELAEEAWAVSVTEGVDTMVADPAIWAKQDNTTSIQDNFSSVGWKMIKGNNDRINGLVIFHDMLKTRGEDGKPMLQVFSGCHAFIRTIPMLTPDPNHLEDVDTRLEDHVYDESRYAVMSDFAKKPNVALQKVFGSWRANVSQGKASDPFNYY